MCVCRFRKNFERSPGRAELVASESTVAGLFSSRTGKVKGHGVGGWTQSSRTTLKRKRPYIRAEEFLPFLPVSFVILWRESPYSSQPPSALSLPDLGTDKGRGFEEGEGEEGS